MPQIQKYFYSCSSLLYHLVSPQIDIYYHILAFHEGVNYSKYISGLCSLGSTLSTTILFSTEFFSSHPLKKKVLKMYIIFGALGIQIQILLYILFTLEI